MAEQGAEELKSAMKVVDVDIDKIVKVMVDKGEKMDDGSYDMEYGALMKTRGVPYDLFARLKTGKQRGIFDYKGQFLMSPLHDKVKIKCLKPDFKIE